MARELAASGSTIKEAMAASKRRDVARTEAAMAATNRDPDPGAAAKVRAAMAHVEAGGAFGGPGDTIARWRKSRRIASDAQIAKLEKEIQDAVASRDFTKAQLLKDKIEWIQKATWKKGAMRAGQAAIVAAVLAANASGTPWDPLVAWDDMRAKQRVRRERSSDTRRVTWRPDGTPVFTPGPKKRRIPGFWVASSGSGFGGIYDTVGDVIRPVFRTVQEYPETKYAIGLAAAGLGWRELRRRKLARQEKEFPIQRLRLPEYLPEREMQSPLLAPDLNPSFLVE